MSWGGRDFGSSEDLWNKMMETSGLLARSLGYLHRQLHNAGPEGNQQVWV